MAKKTSIMDGVRKRILEARTPPLIDYTPIGERQVENREVVFAIDRKDPKFAGDMLCPKCGKVCRRHPIGLHGLVFMCSDPYCFVGFNEDDYDETVEHWRKIREEEERKERKAIARRARKKK